MKNKIVSAADAIAIIRDGDTIAFSGFVGSGTPDELIAALEKRFVETASPRDLTLLFAAAPGDGKDRGLNRLARNGLVKKPGKTASLRPRPQPGETVIRRISREWRVFVKFADCLDTRIAGHAQIRDIVFSKILAVAKGAGPLFGYVATANRTGKQVTDTNHKLQKIV